MASGMLGSSVQRAPLDDRLGQNPSRFPARTRKMSTINPTSTPGPVLPIHGQDAIHRYPGDFQILKGRGLLASGRQCDCWIVAFTLDIPWTQ